MPRLQIPWAAWHGDRAQELDFPDRWEVHLCVPRDAPALGSREIGAALGRTIDAPPLRQIAASRKTAVIAVDDLTRPTQASQVAPWLLDELTAAGIAADDVFFLVSLGSHAPLSREELTKKLGDEIVARYRVLNHDCERDLVDMGIKVGNVPVRLNAAFMAADLKILLGSVMPHTFAGFSGGAKMVLPGLSDIESIEWTHKIVMMGLHGRAGTLADNRFRKEFERVARHAGIDFTVQVVVNAGREIAGVFAGDLEAAHREAAAFAAGVYATSTPPEADVAILNAYPKDLDLLQADNGLIFHRSAPREYLKDDGLILLASACSLGLGHHGLFAPGQRLYHRPSRKGFLGSRELAAFMPGVTEEVFHQVYWDGYPHFGSWPEARAFVEHRRPDRVRVSVLPCSSIQIADGRAS